MNSHRPSKKSKTGTTTKLAISVAVIFIIAYGFYIESQDFHPAEGFQQHRKALPIKVEAGSELEKPQSAHIQEQAHEDKVQRESEQLQLATNRQEEKKSEQDNILRSAKQEDLPAQDEQAQAPRLPMGPSNQSSGIAVEVTNSIKPSSKLDSQTVQSQAIQRTARIVSNNGMLGFTTIPSMEDRKLHTDAAFSLHKSADNRLGTKEEDWKLRQEAVRSAAKESWKVYEQYAMGEDELAPLSLKGKSSISFGGMAATLIDSLDTLWMLDLKEEFQRARDWISIHLDFDKRARISLFETVIRIIGGLISAYDLSGDRLFLDKSQQLVDKLMPSLNTSKTGIPTNLVQFNAPPGEFKKSEIGRAALAEFGSIQVEFLALSQRTSNATYGDKAEALIKTLHDNYPDKGLLPVWFSRKQAKSTGSQLYTVGAMADSFFEYLLKMWLLHQKQVEMYRMMWEKAIDEILEQLVVVNSQGMVLIGQRRNKGMFSAKMEHLACYLPGNMALGVAEGAINTAKGLYYLEAAANLTSTCFQLYNSTKTGLGLDVAMFSQGGAMTPKVTKNVLRPETVESLFYMWRVTGDLKYREWGWRIFQAFQMYSRTPEGAYAAVKDVNKLPVEQEDSMESFWLAETLKYLWLLFGSDELLSLSEWVLNTEAHPFRIALPT